MLEVAYILVALAFDCIFSVFNHYCTKAWTCYR